MPKIVINEQEQIKAAPLSITENIVFVPVFTKNPEKQGKYTLYSSAYDFTKDFKGDEDEFVVKLGDLFDKSYVLARTILSTGLKVLVYGVERSSDFLWKPGELVDENITSFESGETKIKQPQKYLKGSIKLYDGENQVTVFNRIANDKTLPFIIESSQNTALQGSDGLSISNAVTVGSVYKTGSIKFYKTVEEAYVEIQPSEISTVGAVSISGTTLSIAQTTFSSATTVTKIEVAVDNYADSIDMVLAVSNTGVVSITNLKPGDILQNITKLEYNLIGEEDIESAENAMASAAGTFLKDILNKNLYDVKFLTNGGYGMSSDLQGSFVAAAGVPAGRGDCLALLDMSEDVKVDELLSTGEEHKAFSKSPFAAAFFPWCTFELSGDIVGSDKTTEYYDLPGSAAYLLAYGLSVQTNANWMAASGVTRGVVPYLKAPKEEITEGQMHQLQGDEKDSIDAYVNPIMMVGSYGYKIWGNRTTYVDKTKDSYFKFLNIRTLLCDIKKVLYDASIRNTFEPNDDVTWINFKAMCSGLLDRMTSGRGLAWYRWKKEVAPQKAMIKAKLIIRPIEAVESFELTVYLTEDEVIVNEESEGE